MKKVKSKLKAYFKNKKLKPIVIEKNKIIEYLEDLQSKEAKLWGVIITDIKNQEDELVEDTSHLIHLINSKKHSTLKQILAKKDGKNFLKDLTEIRKDFLALKKAIRDQDKLKLLISNFTIKLVDSANYEKFKLVFLLERDLYEVLDRQELELNRILMDVSRLKIETENQKVEIFMETLKDLRDILAGHLDNFKYFEEDRLGFSNTSNLIHELIKIFEQDID